MKLFNIVFNKFGTTAYISMIKLQTCDHNCQMASKQKTEAEVSQRSFAVATCEFWCVLVLSKVNIKHVRLNRYRAHEAVNKVHTTPCFQFNPQPQGETNFPKKCDIFTLTKLKSQRNPLYPIKAENEFKSYYARFQLVPAEKISRPTPSLQWLHLNIDISRRGLRSGRSHLRNLLRRI